MEDSTAFNSLSTLKVPFPTKLEPLKPCCLFLWSLCTRINPSLLPWKKVTIVGARAINMFMYIYFFHYLIFLMPVPPLLFCWFRLSSNFVTSFLYGQLSEIRWMKSVFLGARKVVYFYAWILQRQLGYLLHQLTMPTM